MIIEAKSPREEIIRQPGEVIAPGMPDEDLIEIINRNLKSAQPKMNELIKIAQDNEKYWAGQQIDRNRLKVGDSDIHVNRILVDIETQIAMITQETPPPWIIATPKDKKGRRVEGKLSRYLKEKWEYDTNMQQKMERMLRNFVLSRIGIIKVYWEDDIEDFNADVLRLENVVFPMEATKVDDAEFIAQYVQMTVQELAIQYPDKANLIYTWGSPLSKITVIEYWGHYYEGKKKMVFKTIKYKDEIIDTDWSPFWRKIGENHFARPKKPFVVMNVLNTAKSIVDDTSLVEQARPLQDLLNRRKRQINRNVDKGIGVVVTTADAMDQDTFDTISPGMDKVYLNGDVEDVRRQFAVVTGRPLEEGIYADMADTKREMDNIFATQDIARGERSAPETLGGRRLLLTSSYGRQDPIRRSYEQVAEEVYSWWVQIIKVKYKKKKPILTPREQETLDDYVRQVNGVTKGDEFDPKELDGKSIRVIIRNGATVAKDPETLKQDAVTLRQVGMINPLTFFEMFGIDNPRKAARQEYLWQSNPALLFPEVSGVDFVDPVAVEHIADINSGRYEAEEETFDPSLGVDAMTKHVTTHSMYQQGVEIIEDIPAFDSLPLEIQNAHRSHLAIETEQLQQMIVEMQRSQQSTGGSPQQAEKIMGGDLPVEEEMSANEGMPIDPSMLDNIS